MAHDGECRLYLDHAATTPPAPEVVEAMLGVMRDGWGNPSSIHRTGQRARQRVEDAREAVAQLIGGDPQGVVFTSGGTEAANMAIWSMLTNAPETRRVIVTSAVEHAAVRAPFEKINGTDWEVLHLEHDSAGRVIPESLREIITARGDEIALLSVMWANNETGVVQPIDVLAAMCADHGIAVHTDATQWVGKMPTDLASVPVDYCSFAGHKFHGPQGLGVLWARPGLHVEPTVVGGGQERGHRGGTENVPAIVGLGVACALAQSWLHSDGHLKMMPVRDAFEAALCTKVASTCINGAAADRVWSVTNVGFPKLEAELLLLALSEAGVDVSAGSACSSGALKASSVLDAIGQQPCQRTGVTYGSIRYSWSRDTQPAMLQQAVDRTAEVIERLVHLHPAAAPSSSTIN
ncbi:MAG: cysteine desulfurase [Phycisphaerales bacterium]|nr:cysteine desulfurase [Phycisphaerales bacterium]